MTYYPDLSEYMFDPANARPGTKNVGWLAEGHELAVFEPSQSLLDTLWRYCRVSVAQTRGVHECELCKSPLANHGQRDGESLLLGTSEIRVFATTGTIFAAPTLIYHYVLAHHYAPPGEFLQALEDSAAPPDPSYFDKLSDLRLSWHDTSPYSGPPRRLGG